MFVSPIRAEQREALQLIVVAIRKDYPLYYMLPLDEQWGLVNVYADMMVLND